MQTRHGQLWLLVGIASAIFLLCFRPVIAFRAYSPMDDLCYLEWSARLVGEAFPRCPSFSFPPGAALMWLPAALFAKFFHGLFGVSFPELLCVGVGLLSFFYWVGSLFALEAILAHYTWIKARVRGVWAFVLVLNIPFLYYATHRTTMVHAPEVFLSLLLVLLLLRGRAYPAVAGGALLTILRPNDFMSIFVTYMKVPLGRRRKWMMGGLLTAVIGLLLFWYGTSGHNGVTISMLANGFKLKRIPRLLFETGWGLVYTAPLWLFIFFASVAKLRSRYDLIVAWLWMLFAFSICAVWWGNGSDFGYRYLLGTYAVAFWIGLELKFDFFALRVLAIFSAAWIFWLTWIYKEFPETTLHLVDGIKWVQPDLQLNSLVRLLSLESYLKPLLHSPIYAAYATAKDSMGPYALAGGVSGLHFKATLFCVIASLSLLLLSIFRVRRAS